MGFDILSEKKATLILAEFGIVKGYKDEHSHAQGGKSAEGNIPIYPQVGPGYQVGVDMKEPDAAGNEKNKRQNDKKDKHGNNHRL